MIHRIHMSHHVPSPPLINSQMVFADADAKTSVRPARLQTSQNAGLLLGFTTFLNSQLMPTGCFVNVIDCILRTDSKYLLNPLILLFV